MICQHCKEQFTPKYWQAKPQQFCSASCRNKARANPPGVNRRAKVERTCSYCNQTFQALLAEVKRGSGLYCSRKCSDAHITSIQDRFWAKVNKTDTCWLWTGANSEGKGNNPKRKWPYGLIGLGRAKFGGCIKAHQFSFELHNAVEVPEGIFICHSCDVTLCVNPDHLFLGTAADNTKDMVLKGRAKGGRPIGTKLTPKSLESFRRKRGFT